MSPAEPPLRRSRPARVRRALRALRSAAPMLVLGLLLALAMAAPAALLWGWAGPGRILEGLLPQGEGWIQRGEQWIAGWVRPGSRLVEVAGVEPAEVRPNEAVEVFLHFPWPERVRPETLEVRLNGAVVTRSFSTASNGAYGDLVLLVDGENVLEVAVFGRAWWSEDVLVEHTVRRRFRVRRPVDRFWG